MRIGFCGRACLQKRPDLFVEVARLVSKAIPGSAFVWIGDGELRQILIDAGVTVTGWTEQPEKEIEKLNIFVSTAAYEGLSYATLEAMSLGIPCVLSEVTGNSDLIRHGINGYLANPESPADFAKWVIEIASNERLKASFSQKARETVLQNFSFDETIRRTHGVYEKILGRQQGRGTKE